MTITNILGIRSRAIAKALGFATKSRRLVKIDLCSNTGLKCHESATQTGSPSSFESPVESQDLASGVDWLMGTIHDAFLDLDDVREFVQYVASSVGDTFVQAAHGIACGIQWHPYLWRAVLHGSQISCMIDDNLRTHVWVSITGKSCRLDQQRLARLMCYLAFKGFTCTRIDCATTDPKDRLKCRQITNAINKGDCSGFRANKSLAIALPNDKDWTRYCGVKNGGKSYTRIYQRPDSHPRIERQFVKRDARLVFADLVHYYDNRDTLVTLLETEYFRKICAYSISGISFIHRISKHLNRCPELRWWTAFKKACATEPIKFPPVTKEESLEVKKRWLERSVSTSLAMMKKWMGAAFPEWIFRIISEGSDRLTDRQMALLHQFRLSLPKDKKHFTFKRLNFKKKQTFTGNVKQQLLDFADLLKQRDDQIFNHGMDF